MRARVRQALPDPAVATLKGLLGLRPIALAVETAMLSRLPAPTPKPTKLRRALDLPAVFGRAEEATWRRVSERIEKSGLRHNPEGVNPGDRRAIAALADYLEPDRVLEVGTHVGASTLTLAATLAGRSSSITTVDVLDVNDPRRRHWELFGAPHPPRHIVEGLAPVEFVVSDSAAYLRATTDTFDFIFLDGGHEARTVYTELPLALSRLNPDGVILMHDYFPRGRRLWRHGEVIVGPYLALRRLMREGWAISVLPVGALPWPTKLGSRVSSLALVVAG